jgi:phosphoglycolate phosphatase-like HAD superfamily hydrolase
MAEIEELVAAVLRRWCPNVAAARRILAEAWFEPDPVERAIPLVDLPELFRALREAGRTIAIATTDDRRPTEATLAGLGLASLVAAISCGNDPGPAKPDPAVLLGLAAPLGIAIGRTAMVGDTAGDLRMARAAGAGRAVGVRSGVAADDELTPHADVVLGNVGELLRPSLV